MNVRISLDLTYDQYINLITLLELSHPHIPELISDRDLLINLLFSSRLD